MMLLHCLHCMSVSFICKLFYFSKQQVEIEHDIRRRYPKKWGDVTKDPRIHLYSNENLNKALSELNGGGIVRFCKIMFPSEQIILCTVVTRPYVYNNSGDSHFVSKEMYLSLYETCRCGRPKTDAHSLKCLQKVQNPYLDSTKNRRSEFLPTIPKTSLGKSPKIFFVCSIIKIKIFQVCMDGLRIDLLVGKCQLVIHHQNLTCQVDVSMDILIQMSLLDKFYWSTIMKGFNCISCFIIV